MATPPLSPATRRLTGLMCMVSGALLLLGLGLKIELGIYSCYALGVPFPSTALLLFNTLGLLASGLLVRFGRQMRQAAKPPADPAR